MEEMFFREPKTDYSNESFIDIAVDNFSDSAIKEIYAIQKYVSILQVIHPHVYAKILHCPNHNDNEDDFINFMVAENENIFCLKGTGFAIAITDLLMRKYERLVREINYENGRIYYTISVNALKFFQSELSNINWHKIRLESFYTDEKIEELVRFDKYVTEKYKYFSEKIKDITVETKTLRQKEMLSLLDKEFMTITTCMLHLKEVTELSTDISRTAVVLRQIIDLVVLTHFIMKTISVNKENKEEDII